MFNPSRIEVKLDAEINSLLDKLKETTKESEEYGHLVDRITRLHKLKTEEHSTQIEDIVTMDKTETGPWFERISPDTALVVAANIFGILWLTRYERENPITSKALGFVMKGKH
jgi:hypothetical protein